ncbi:hypothetical protein MTHERMMSTA1_23580 [Methanosarcina thermophila MST-A1]|jgi:hypothetical protein|uniref:Minor extracellular protease epr n=1 Tax=Methanosarcina thermophila TaxID=2210 RepID=A0A3G9D045_METTE|nr:hypothetical protein [Methanosarcina thermophila]BAW30627.1 minor extracellular protease epr [Methanosarcina thermophila]GLI15232.1 hypothetical protein MTHERMMSTA1_23580 [Methanosarcina thermophila MST-A1]HOA68195.1 hypothetical protein [Methanosarcina thermophila]HOQ65095.1 hypothetical protein [Methanosarcina thermophila]HPT80387.1 hypothetical protein [Methanosarcina thermophila]
MVSTDIAKIPGFEIDPEYMPVPVKPTEETARALAAVNEEYMD